MTFEGQNVEIHFFQVWAEHLQLLLEAVAQLASGDHRLAVVSQAAEKERPAVGNPKAPAAAK